MNGRDEQEGGDRGGNGSNDSSGSLEFAIVYTIS